MIPKQNSYMHSMELRTGFVCSRQILLEETSIDSAVDGCVGVFHTASRALISTIDPQVYFSHIPFCFSLSPWKNIELNNW